MKRVPVISARDAGALISDDDVVTVSSSSGLGCPDTVLRGVGEHFAEVGSPRGLTTIHPIAAGDMSGIKGIDHLVQPGLVRRVIAGSYPSGPSSMEPPLIWQAIENDAIEAYNLPSGALFQMHRAGAAGQPGVFTHVGLDTFVDPRHSGGRMNERTTEDLVRVEQLDGQEWLYYPAVRPDVAIIRASTADEWGNLSYEDEGSALGALDQAYAAHNNGGTVIAQVRRLAAGDSLSPRAVVVPGILVDAVVVDPDQLQTTGTTHDPALSGELRRPISTLEPTPWSLEKVIARRAACEIHPGDIVNLGFGISAPRATDPRRGGARGPGHLGHRAGRGGRCPIDGLRVRLRDEPAGAHAERRPVHAAAGRGLRSRDALLPRDRRAGQRQRPSLASPPARHRRRGRVRGHHLARARAGLQRQLHRRATRRRRPGRCSWSSTPTASCRSWSSACTRSRSRAGARSSRARSSSTSPSGASSSCVHEGLTVVEIAAGVDLEADVLARAEFELQVASDLTTMDPRLFASGPIGLELGAATLRASEV